MNSTDRVLALIDGALHDDEIGLDAMRWQPPVPPAARICVGDVVDYHGSLATEHGEYVIVAVSDRLTLRNHDYPGSRMSNVRRSSVTATGRWVPVCRCEHPHVHPRLGPTGRCPRHGCNCPHHP